MYRAYAKRMLRIINDAGYRGWIIVAGSLNAAPHSAQATSVQYLALYQRLMNAQ